ncbi:thioredoxin family protein [Micromonospora mangrovi]|uniref:Thioredoxin family protein n=2 Tax=Micromonospora TaxID=1873 RepID=A0AAU7MF80_9ACTN
MQEPSVTGLVVVVVVLALASAFGWWRRHRDGRLRPVATLPVATRPDESAGATLPAALTDLGVRAGTVTLVQFSSPVCAPCRATRRVLDEVRAAVDGVHLVEVGVDEHLDLARELDIWRTPTVLVVDPAGRIAQRAAGVPAKDDLVAAVTPLLAGARR